MQTKKIAKNTIYLYLRQGVTMLVSLFTVRILLGALGDVDYGVFNVVAGFVLMFGFFNTSLTNGVQRFYNFEAARKGDASFATVYKSALRIQWIAGVLLVLALETVGVWYLNHCMVIPGGKTPEANWLMQLSLVSLLLTMLNVPYQAAMVAKERFNVFAGLGIFDTLMKLGIAYSLYLFSKERLIIYGALLSIISLADLAVSYIYCRVRIRQIFGRAEYDRKLTRSMIGFMGWNTLGSGAYLVRTQGVNLLFNAFFGVLLNTANGIATQVATALQYFTSNIVSAFKPQLIQAYARGDDQASFRMMVLMTRISYALVFMLAVPVMLDIDFILRTWLGNRVPPYTSSLAVLVVISVIIACWHTPIVSMIHATGKMRKFQAVTACAIVSIVPVTWVGFRFGLSPDWAYWATIIAYSANQVAANIVLKQQFPYSVKGYLRQAILPCLSYSAAVLAVPMLLRQVLSPGILQLAGLSAVTLATALAAAYLLILSPGERASVKQWIRAKIIKNHVN